ncbi:DUF6473 family protein [uncultured Aliiroseovarius sp.]|uniref:DUF6473 family protein n=1 Tax=uncultured Aliiroseovarius sp. TaxID=1658783 RepID=UPI00260B1FBF|nr:DUF6473 family protein [uncultured Aliiroseovarius sp.]
MAYETLGKGSLDYVPCRYGASKILFRGPKKKLTQPYLAMLGGTETYGKFVERPYPALVERDAGITSVNLGCPNAGVDAFVYDDTLIDACKKAEMTVVQIMGAHNMSNRFYAVHPRRNDRFLRASKLLKAIYREVDFTEFNFTRHLLNTLEEISADRFAMIQQELREAWVARMKMLISRLNGNVVLLWMSDHAIADGGRDGIHGTDPLFVDQDMINEVKPFVRELVEVVVAESEISVGREDLVYSDMDEPATHQMLGTVAHRKANRALQEVLQTVI